MLDGRYGAQLNRVWDALATPLVRAGCTPNFVTCAGFLLVAAAASAYLAHGDSLIFAATLAFAFAFDGLDGAVARLTGRSTKFGGYLDAVVDRYQELVVLAAIAWVHDLWPVVFLVVTGGILTSYNKARAAMEIAITNSDWPDLVERTERIILLIGVLVLHGLMPFVPRTGA